MRFRGYLLFIILFLLSACRTSSVKDDEFMNFLMDVDRIEVKDDFSGLQFVLKDKDTINQIKDYIYCNRNSVFYFREDTDAARSFSEAKLNANFVTDRYSIRMALNEGFAYYTYNLVIDCGYRFPELPDLLLKGKRESEENAEQY